MTTLGRTFVGAGIGFYVALAVGMIGAAFAITYALLAGVVGAAIGAVVGFCYRP
jgi:hypothetical protein